MQGSSFTRATPISLPQQRYSYSAGDTWSRFMEGPSLIRLASSCHFLCWFSIPCVYVQCISSHHKHFVCTWGEAAAVQAWAPLLLEETTIRNRTGEKMWLWSLSPLLWICAVITTEDWQNSKLQKSSRLKKKKSISCATLRNLPAIRWLSCSAPTVTPLVRCVLCLLEHPPVSAGLVRIKAVVIYQKGRLWRLRRVSSRPEKIGFLLCSLRCQKPAAIPAPHVMVMLLSALGTNRSLNAATG